MAKAAHHKLVDENESFWCPKPKELYTNFVRSIIADGSEKRDLICDNLSYALQYIDYLHYCFECKKLHNVIYTQLVKTHVVYVFSVIECILHSFCQEKNLWLEQSDWTELKAMNTSKTSEQFGVQLKVETKVFEKKSSKKKSDAKDIVKALKRYTELDSFIDKDFLVGFDELRQVRNKIHLQITPEKDLKYFDHKRLKQTTELLKHFVNSKIFPQSDIEKAKLFDYL